MPELLVIDNLKAAVTKADWYDPDLNPKFRDFLRHYGIACVPSRPYTPRHKGKIESGIDYAQENALEGADLSANGSGRSGRDDVLEQSEQGELFELRRYRYVITNLPSSTTTTEVVRQTYQRCDQEKVIEQLQNGIAAMRVPTGTLEANAAFLGCARIAHNFNSWLAMMALPREVLRWEWKRFQMACVYIAARVVRQFRRTIVRLADSHRFTETIRVGVSKLQT